MGNDLSPIVRNNLISVKDSAEYSGYSLQYIRRLLRLKNLGQVWLIDKEDFEAYLLRAAESTDRRIGPHAKTIENTSFIKLRLLFKWKFDVKLVLDKKLILVYYTHNTLVH